MKRAGFTMIELIFVIVILGILAAVALPKFIGVSEQAEAGKCKALVGTMNRTVGPALWSDSLLNSNKGKMTSGTVAPYNSVANAVLELKKQLEIPDSCITGQSQANIGTTFFADGNGTDIPIGNNTFVVAFTEGNNTSASEWTWTKKP